MSNKRHINDIYISNFHLVHTFSSSSIVSTLTDLGELGLELILCLAECGGVDKSTTTPRDKRIDVETAKGFVRLVSTDFEMLKLVSEDFTSMDDLLFIELESSAVLSVRLLNLRLSFSAASTAALREAVSRGAWYILVMGS
jgi:hypothetical protein